MKHSDLITLTGEHRVPSKEHIANVQRGLGTVTGVEVVWRLFLAGGVLGLGGRLGRRVDRRVDWHALNMSCSDG